MGELIFIMAVGLSFIGIGFLVVKYPMQIGSYNVLPKHERDKIDIRPYALFMRKAMIIMGSIIIIGSLILHLAGLREWWIVLLLVTIFTGAGILLKKERAFYGARKKSKMQKWSFRIAIAIVVILFVCIIDTGRPAKIEVKDNTFIIHGAYNQRIPLDSITGVAITDHLPYITIRTNGLSFWKYHKGYYQSKEEGRIMLFLHSKGGPFLVVKSKRKPTIFINRNTKEEVEELYEKLKK